MRKVVVLALATTLTGVAVPASSYYWSKPTDDAFTRTMHGLGFLPIMPPSKLVSVGSLYYVDPAARFFRTVCHAEDADLEGLVIVSQSAKVVASELHSGQFDSGVRVNIEWLIRGDVSKNYQLNVQYSLTDVLVREISLGNNRRVFAKMMEKAECSDAVADLIDERGYICQVQQVLEATAEFKIQEDEGSKINIETEGKLGELKDRVKSAIEQQSEQSVVERSGRLLAGSALNYGVSMNPICLAPPHARFARVLPKTIFDRIRNFALYSLIEPIWPVAVRPA